MTAPILRTATLVTQPLFLLFSLFLLVRGHDAPGGGFAGGLIAAAAFAQHALAFDVASSRRRLRVRPRALIGAGLLIAALAGLIGPAFDRAWYAGTWATIPLPGGISVEIGSPLLFDAGVYLVVLGTATLVIFSLEEA